MSINLHLSFPPIKSSFEISYDTGIFLLGSCFTTHLAQNLSRAKFRAMANPSGTIFDPLSIARTLKHYRELPKWQTEDLLFFQTCYYSWDHHSTLGAPEPAQVLANIEKSQKQAHNFLKHANFLILTLGTAFYYCLNPNSASDKKARAVANCHKYPAENFTRYLLDYREIAEVLQTEILAWQKINPNLRVILSVSPVRHGKNGGNALVENSQSKAQLILATKQLCEQNSDFCNYFPAYEILVDCLRDYRFYDADLIHPNYLATEIIINYFAEYFLSAQSQKLKMQIQSITLATNHRPMHQDSQAHLDFLHHQVKEIHKLIKLYPHIDLHAELAYFQNSIINHPLQNTHNS